MSAHTHHNRAGSDSHVGSRADAPGVPAPHRLLREAARRGPRDEPPRPPTRADHITNVAALPRGKARHLRVLTWNCGGTGPAKADFLRSLLAEAHPAFVCLQEVTKAEGIPRSWNWFPHPHMAEGRWKVGIAVDVNALNLFNYNNPRLVVINDCTVGVTVTHAITGEDLTVYSTHAPHTPALRTARLREIAEHAIANGGIAIVGGDFNCCMGRLDTTLGDPNATLRVTFDVARWQDPVRLAHPDSVLWSRNPAGQAWRRIDYVLVHGVRPVWAGHLHSVSDHHVIVADVDMKEITGEGYGGCRDAPWRRERPSSCRSGATFGTHKCTRSTTTLLWHGTRTRKRARMPLTRGARPTRRLPWRGRCFRS